ncbi:MAG TPA: chromate efflux transporter [Gammaproteobacteria bacterium]|nr:chromate efflux transporter [Gammaproteobacteria bacterium]
MPIPPQSPIPFRDALRIWWRIGLTSFGGPAGQIALMHRLLVEELRWIGERRFLHALNYCMLLPGPEAQQLAIYLGWLMHRTAGGIVAGVLFVLPGFVVILVLSMLYAAAHDAPLVEAAFYGIKAAVLAIVLEAVLRIGRRTLRRPFPLALAATAFVAIFFFAVPFPWIVLTAGLAGLAAGRLAPHWLPSLHEQDKDGGAPPALLDRLLETGAEHLRPSLGRALRVLGICLALWAAPIVLAAWLAGRDDVFVELGVFFSKMAVVTFGGAYAVLSYVAQEAVMHYGWLAPGEMIDGLALAETTPGPLILVVEFVGFLAAWRDAGTLDPWLAGTLGALLVTWVTFVPCFLWIFLGAPHVERLRESAVLAGALAGVTAAVTGVVLNLALWFGMHALFGTVGGVSTEWLEFSMPVWHTFDAVAASIAAAAFLALFKTRLGILCVLALAAAAGMVSRYF